MMGFWIVYTLIALPCILFTGYALTAYTGYPLWLAVMTYLLLAAAWFSMALIWHLRVRSDVSVQTYTIISKIGYFMLGFAFLLMCVLGARDALWLTAYLFFPSDVVAPFEPQIRYAANVGTLCLVGALSLYSFFAALKMPKVRRYSFSDVRIRRPLKILALSDLHINRTISAKRVRQFVQYFSRLHPDVILMAGDITDDFLQYLGAHLRELKKLQAPLGIYVVLGNHEVYHNAMKWESTYAGLGWQVLHNSGVELENIGVYIGGMPSHAGFYPNPEQALRRANENTFKITMVHEPAIARYKDSALADLQISGHTHGGQIFPFHFPVRWGNAGFVGGSYVSSTTIVLVSNGAGYWGPPMRLGASSDVLFIELQPN